MHKQTLFKILSLMAIFVMIFSTNCGGKKPSQTPEKTTPVEKTSQAEKTAEKPTQAPVTPTTQPSPTARVTPTLSPLLRGADNGAPLAPKVIAQNPASQEEVSLKGSFELYFDQPMDKTTTTQALEVAGPDGKPISGSVTWPEPRILRFTPNQSLAPASTYTASLKVNARSAGGSPLTEALRFYFQTTGELQVSQVSPADGTVEVDSKSIITVIFNRPVVPLMISEDQSKLPIPLEITPTINGKGEWLNTAVYVFRPEPALVGSTTYFARVKAGLTDSEGMQLAEDFSWQFRTIAPSVDSLNLPGLYYGPPENYTNVTLNQSFEIMFRQPMDRSSTEAGFSVTPENGSSVEGVFSWNEVSTSFVFTPTNLLALGTDYTLNLDPSVQAQTGGSLREGIVWHFETVLEPAIGRTYPYDGMVQSEYSSNLEISFVSPMKQSSLKDKVIITPAPRSDAQWMYYEWGMSFYGLEPSTNYEVQILPGMTDVYGNQINKTTVLHFRTAAYPPSANLLMPFSTPLYRVNGSQVFYVSYTNVKQIDFELYQIKPNDYANLTEIGWSSFQPDRSLLVRKWSEMNTLNKDQRAFKPIPLTNSEGKPLPTGIYFLTLDSPEIRHEARWLESRVFVVASANLTYKATSTEALLWLTDLDSGLPVANADIKVYNQALNVTTPTLNPIGHGLTDGKGLLKLDLPLGQDPMERRYAFAYQPGTENIIGVASNGWDNIVYMEMFGIYSDYYVKPGDPVGYIYTDRPLYRPGQTVYYKGIVRLNDDLTYSLPKKPEEQTVYITIDSFEGTVYTQTLTLSDQGTFEGEFLLDKEAALGGYTIGVKFLKSEYAFSGVSFNVAEYKKPEFQLNVKTNKTDIQMGDTFEVTVEADFYSGGGVGNAEVSWILVANSYSFYPTGDLANKGYSFSDFDWDWYYYMNPGEFTSKIIAQGSGTTDQNGKLTLKLPSDVPDVKGSQQLTLEASVTDLTGNVVSERTSVIAHKTAYYPGIKSDTYVGTVGKDESFSLVLVDWNSAPVPNQEVSVSIVERRWSSVQEEDAQGRLQWTTSVEDIPVISKTLIKTNIMGFATISFKPPNGGTFKAIITYHDKRGGEARASSYMWVSGVEYIPWRQTNDKSFELITDKKSYLPGETAEVLIASPFQGQTHALITIERGRILFQDVITLTTNSTVYKLPITPKMAPNIYISVMVIKGVEEVNGKVVPPNFKVGMVDISVGTQQQALNVEVTPDRTEASPGEQVTYLVTTTNYQGNPVSAEVSLSLVDLAVLDLMGPNTSPLIDYFYPHRYLSVLTSVPLVWNIEEYNAQLKDIAPTGEGMGSGGGGEKGAGLFGVVDVRGNFKDTAYWKARILTDADGIAKVTITLPDNLTTWRMDARAVTIDTRVGQATSDLLSTKPLLVRPQAPRFFVVNDQSRLSAAIHNNTSETLVIDAKLEASGVTLNSEAIQTISINPNSQALVTWLVTVNPDAERVDLTYSAEGGGYSDASKPTLGTLEDNGIPVYRYEVPETVATSGSINVAGARTESISLPFFADYSLSQVSLKVELSPSLAAGMTDGLTYLEHYPYECTEQTVSRFLPNVETTRAFIEAGIRDETLENNLKEQVNTALQRLYAQQHGDGGWGWWQEDLSDVQTTAYVVFGMTEAQAAGYTVKQASIDEGINFLQVRLLNLRSLDEKYILNRQAFVLYVLAKAGKAQPSWNVQLYNIRQSLSLYGRAYLAQALAMTDPADTRLNTMISDLVGSAALSATGAHWSEGSSDYWNWNTDTRSTAIILDALIKLDPKNPLLENVVRWLMINRTDGRWQSTQETAWSLMALTDWMIASGELQASYLYEAGLNGASLGSGTVNQDNLRQSQELTVDIASLLVDQVNRLTIARTDGPGNLYYTAHLTVDLPVEQVKALDRGIIIRRSYSTLEDPKTPITEIQLGQVFLAKLTIVVPESMHYIVIDDPLPAGTEAVDESLKTSQQLYTQPQAGWQGNPYLEGWGWWLFDHVEKRDEKVVLSVNFLPAGTYEYIYRVRATMPGTYHVIPPTAQEFYFPEVYGRGDGMLFVVKP